MKLYIVRHGQTDWNAKGLMQGNTDTSLNQIGRKQAKRIQEELKEVSFDICISSPLGRAYETAFIVCNGRVPLLTDKRLEERDLGEYEGECPYDGRFYWDYTLNSSSKGVEPVQDLLHRVSSFYEELKSTYKDSNILIVTHGAIVRALHFIITGYNEDTNFMAFDVPNCHVFEYEV